jgi:23S rRNA (guanine2445-N2)-methyltransferase / 23S rRNA (guanine2069-N7)-methyltransferase
LGAEAANLALTHQLGRFLMAWQQPWRLGLLCADESMAQATRLKAERYWHFRNGSIPCRFYLFRSKEVPASFDENSATATASDPSPRDGGEGLPSAGLPSAGLPSAGLPSAGLSPSLQAFLNRVEKNWRSRRKWARRQQLEAYRIYDADLPDFNLVLDLYGGHLVVAEYQAPKEIPEEKAQRRLHDALLHLPPLLEIPPSQVWLKKRRRQLPGDQYRKAAEGGRRVAVREGAGQFWVNLSDYLDTGLFLDSRKVRTHLAARARGAHLLNLFCYTGTATVQAALAGLTGSTNVDLSGTYLDWAAANFQLNGLDKHRHRLVRSDVFTWLEEDRERYELIYLDPPTFSNSKGLSFDFDLQRDHRQLLQSCLKRLLPGGCLIFVHHFLGFQMEWSAPEGYSLQDRSRQMTPEDFARRSPSRVWLIEASPA